MKILGIDPGLERVGFGLIAPNASQQYHALDWGVIKTSKTQSHAQRLHGIHTALTALLEEMKPDMAGLEKLFFFRNVTTMAPVSEARGIIILALYTAGIPIYEYTPLQVKQNMTGFGKADKNEVQTMVKTLLNMDEIPRPDDAADALAIALSCAFDQSALGLLKCVN